MNENKRQGKAGAFQRWHWWAAAATGVRYGGASSGCGVAPCGAWCRPASRARRPRRPGGQAAGAPRPRRAGEKEGGKLSHKQLAVANMAPQYHAPIVARITASEPCRCCCSCRPSSPSYAPRVPACTPGTLERTLHSCCSCCTPTVSESDTRTFPPPSPLLGAWGAKSSR